MTNFQIEAEQGYQDAAQADWEETMIDYAIADGELDGTIPKFDTFMLPSHKTILAILDEGEVWKEEVLHNIMLNDSTVLPTSDILTNGLYLDFKAGVLWGEKENLIKTYKRAIQVACLKELPF